MFLRAVCLLAVAAAVREVSGYAADLCEANLGIINGHKIPIEDAPYIAALKITKHNSKQDFLCGSVIIHERFLLTAAHCVLETNMTIPVYASMGSERYLNTSKNTLVDVEKFLPHEHYDFGLNKNDIGLVKLKKPIPFSKNIVKIELADKNFDVEPGTMVTISGWGIYDNSDDDHPKSPLDLLQTTVPVLSHKCCQEADDTVDDAEICAGVKGRGPCNGDSGGPMVYNNVLVGVVSHAGGDPDPVCGSGMDVYTKVNAYLDWINATIADNL